MQVWSSEQNSNTAKQHPKRHPKDSTQRRNVPNTDTANKTTEKNNHHKDHQRR